MSRAPLDPELCARLAPLAPHARRVLERAVEHARRLQANALGLPHLLTALMRDEDAAAHHAVLHLFADPETIAAETMALSEGVLVVGTGRSMPFSVLGARALAEAGRHAHLDGATTVQPSHLFAAAHAALGSVASAALAGAGLRAQTPAPPAAEVQQRPADDSLLSDFDAETMRACGIACRIAAQQERDSITPAHLLCAALEACPELEAGCGLGSRQVRSALRGLDEDSTPLAAGELPTEAALLDWLEALPPGAGSLELLAQLVESGPANLRTLLSQHCLERSALALAGAAYRDPE